MRLKIGLAVVAFLATVALAPDVSSRPDTLKDWLAVHALVNGGDPYSTSIARDFDLSDQINAIYGPYQVEIPDQPETPVPRLPGANLLSTPLLIFDLDDAATVAVVANAVAIVGILWLVRPSWVLLAPVVMLLPPLRTATYAGNFGPLIMLVLVAAWDQQRRGNQRWAGLWAGVAAVFRAWPLLLVVAWWIGDRRRAGSTAGGVFLGLNVAAVGLFGWHPGMIEAFAAASSNMVDHPGNASLAAFTSPTVGITVGSVFALLVLWKARNRGDVYLPAVTAALVASTISWPLYQLALLPVLASRLWPILAVGWTLMVILPVAPVALGTVVVLFLAAVFEKVGEAVEEHSEPVDDDVEDLDGVALNDGRGFGVF